VGGVVDPLVGEPAQGGGDGVGVTVDVERSGGGGVVYDAGGERVVEERTLADGLACRGGE